MEVEISGEADNPDNRDNRDNRDNPDNPELQEKLERVRALMSSLGLDALLLRRPSNVAWIGGGGRTYVNIAVETGVGSLLITRNERYLLTDVIEERRLAEEEGFGRGGWQVVAEAWHEPPRELAAITSGMSVGADLPTEHNGCAAYKDVGGEVARLRWHLTPAEVARYRALGRDIGAAIGRVARAVRPGKSEDEIAGLIAQATYGEGAVPVVVLVATDERIHSRRHPLPTGKRLERTALLVLCARRHGLIVSLTRLVNFGPISDEQHRRMHAVATIEAAAIQATRPGVKANSVFARIVEAYAATGFSGEWAHHHQGGSVGYATRDYIANPLTEFEVEPVQAFAWNPSVPGAKSEDTFLISEAGPELLTATPDWPYQQVEAAGTLMARPDMLEI